MPSSRKKIIISVALFLTVGILAVGYLLYDRLSDLEALRNKAVQKLETLTQRSISIGSADLSFEDGIGVNLSQVVLKDKSGGKGDVTLERVLLVLRLLPLLQNKIEIKEMSVAGWSIQISRDSEGKWNLPGMQNNSSKDPNGLANIISLGLFKSLSLTNGKLRLTDNFIAPASDPVTVDFKNVTLVLKKQLMQARYRFSLFGEVVGPGKSTSLVKVDGKMGVAKDSHDVSVVAKIKLRQIYLPDFAPYMELVFAQMPEEKWISADSDVSGNFAGKIKSKGRIQIYRRNDIGGPAISDLEKPSRGTIDYQFSLLEDTINFESLKYRSGKFNFNFNGEYAGFRSENPSVLFAISSNEFDVQQTETYLPFLLFHSDIHQKVKDSFKKGRVAINSLTFSGSLDQLNNLSDPKNQRLFTADLSLHLVQLDNPLPELHKVSGSLKFAEGNSEVNIHKAEFEGFKISKLAGKTANVFTNPIADLTLESRLDLKKIDRLLKRFLDKKSLAEIKNSYENMTGEGKALINFKGPLKFPNRMGVNGKISVRKGFFVKKKPERVFKNVQGNIIFHRFPKKGKGKGIKISKESLEVRLEEFSGKFNNHSFSGFGGTMTLGKDSLVREVSGNLKFGSGQIADIIPSHFTEQYLPLIKDIALEGGEASINVKVEGKLQDSKSVQRKTALDLKNVTLTHQSKYQPLKIASARVNIHEDGRISLLKGKMIYGRSPVEMSGEIKNTSSKKPDVTLRIHSPELYNSDFKDIPGTEFMKYEGPVGADIFLSRKKGVIKFKNELDFSQAGYKYGELFEKPVGVSNKVRSEGSISKKGVLTFNSLVYEIAGNKIKGKGTIKDLDRPDFKARFESKGFLTSAVAPHIKGFEGNRSGEIDFKVAGKGNLKDLKNCRLKGNVELKKLIFKTENIAKPFILSSNVKVNGKEFIFTKGALGSEHSSVLFDGRYVMGPHPILELALVGDKFYLEELLPHSGDSENKFDTAWAESKIITHGSGNIKMKISRFALGSWRLRNLVGQLSFKKRKFDIAQIRVGKAGENLVSGRGSFALEDSGDFVFDSTIVAKNIKAQGFFDIFGDTFENSLSGRIKRLGLKIKSRGKNWEELTRALEGKASLHLQNGKVDSVGLRIGAVRLFNIPVGDNFMADRKREKSGYKSIAGKFLVENGIAYTKRFNYETDEQKMSLVGDFDLNQLEMDTVVGVAPLHALDKVLAKIPVVGKILTAGDEQSLIKTYYEIKGPFKDPRVTSVPIKSLGKKFAGILQGILQTPQEIFAPSSDTASN